MSKNNADLIRARLRASRRAMSIDARQHGSQLLCSRLQEWLNTFSRLRKDGAPVLTLAAFWPLQDEPDLTPLLRSCAVAGITIALPVVIKRHTPLEFHKWTPTGAPLVPGAFGVMEPLRQTPLQPNVVLVPTLGYTNAADRLGYGAGYYDRTLNAMQRSGQSPVTIGIAWNEGLLDVVAPFYVPQAHDMPLDAVLTPDGWVPAPPATTG